MTKMDTNKIFKSISRSKGKKEGVVEMKLKEKKIIVFLLVDLILELDRKVF